MNNKSEKIAREIKRTVLTMAHNSSVAAHLGGSLSIVDILAVLYTNIMRWDPSNPEELSRDRFILSKGHGALALFATLGVVGLMSKAQLDSYMKHASDLIAHPVRDVSSGIESSNGSLGHGLSFAAGKCEALKQLGSSSKVFTLIGDGECNEGSIWEGAMYASSRSLNNLVAIIDWNRFQSDGLLVDKATPQELSDRWKSFGWNVSLIDGHNHDQLNDAFIKLNANKPNVVIAKTIKGHGVTFMEDDNNWHHAVLSEVKFREALESLN